jgi:hypothetical protein
LEEIKEHQSVQKLLGKSMHLVNTALVLGSEGFFKLVKDKLVGLEEFVCNPLNAECLFVFFTYDFGLLLLRGKSNTAEYLQVRVVYVSWF